MDKSGDAFANRTHRELLLNYFRARKAFSSGVIEGLNNKALTDEGRSARNT